MKIRRLVIISKEYPSESDPIYPFVDQLARAFSDAGVSVTVIAPMSLTRTLLGRRGRAPRRTDLISSAGNAFCVLRPRFVSFSNKAVGPVNCAELSYRAFCRAAASALRGLPEKPDAIYGHFIAPSGMAAARFGRALGVPSFLAFGESTSRAYAGFSNARIQKRLESLAGVVSVSGDNKRALLEDGLYRNAARVGVFPNGIDETLFKPGDRAAARRRLGIGEDEFALAFVGSFIERKGPLRLAEAADRVGGVKTIFIGRGPQEPNPAGLIFRGPLPHGEIPAYLAAADGFCLPTQNEGCCNAVVEALAMGLPVLSANRPFNRDLLNENNALLFDPDDIEQIANAIRQLKEDCALRKRLSLGALETAGSLTISRRAAAILKFMEGLSGETENAQK